MSTSFQMVKLDTLLTSRAHGTQRIEGCDIHKVAKMVRNWDIRKVGTITVSEREDGSRFCIDGANRATAAKEIGLTELPGIVHSGLTRQQEAAMFSGLNDFTRPSAISRFMARVDEEEPSATAIKRIVESHGWRISANADAGCIAAVDALDRIYRNGVGTLATGEHADLVDWTMGVITRAWDHDRDAANGMVIQGVAQLGGRFGGAVDVKVLGRQMAQSRPLALVGKAKMLRDAHGGTAPAHLASILHSMHNSRKREHKLPDWVWVK